MSQICKRRGSASPFCDTLIHPKAPSSHKKQSVKQAVLSILGKRVANIAVVRNSVYTFSISLKLRVHPGSAQRPVTGETSVSHSNAVPLVNDTKSQRRETHRKCVCLAQHFACGGTGVPHSIEVPVSKHIAAHARGLALFTTARRSARRLRSIACKDIDTKNMKNDEMKNSKTQTCFALRSSIFRVKELCVLCFYERNSAGKTV